MTKRMRLLAGTMSGCAVVAITVSCARMVTRFPERGRFPDFINDLTLVTAENPVLASPAIADMDGDGDLEIVVAVPEFPANATVYVWHHDGRLAAGWPRQTPRGRSSHLSPIVADLDRDGESEIIWGTYVWTADGSTVNGWPIKPGDFSALAAADLDGDGKLELIGEHGRNEIEARRMDGSVLPGWPQLMGGRARSPIAVGDINQDGAPEVFAGSLDLKLYGWHNDGKPLPGYPISIDGDLEGPQALADVNGDGRSDAVVTPRGLFDGQGAQVGSVKYYPGFSYAALVPARLRSEDDLIVAAPAGLFDLRGDPLPGWPIRVTYSSSGVEPCLADLSGDGLPDLLWNHPGMNFVYAHNMDGSSLPGWPRWIVNDSHSVPAVADLDGDGDVEVVTCSGYGRIHVWDEPAIYDPRTTPWPMDGGNAQREGAARPLPKTSRRSPRLTPIRAALCRGDFDTAVKRYRQVEMGRCFSCEARAEAALSIARIYNWRLQDDEGAFAEYERFIARHPNSCQIADAFLELTDLYQYRLVGQGFDGRFRTCTDMYAKIIRTRKADAKERFFLVSAYLALEDHRSHDAIKEIIETAPKSHWAELARMCESRAAGRAEMSVQVTDIAEGDLPVEKNGTATVRVSRRIGFGSQMLRVPTFPCSFRITTPVLSSSRWGTRIVRALGPRDPHPRDPFADLGWEELSNRLGRFAKSISSAGDVTYEWHGTLGRRFGQWMFDLCPVEVRPDISVERTYKMLTDRRRLCTMRVTAPFAVNVHVMDAWGLISSSVKPETARVLGADIFFPGGRRAEPDGKIVTTDYSFEIELPPTLDDNYPRVSIMTVRPAQIGRPSSLDVGKPVHKFTFEFDGDTYQIFSPRLFQVTDLTHHEELGFMCEGPWVPADWCNGSLQTPPEQPTQSLGEVAPVNVKPDKCGKGG